MSDHHHATGALALEDAPPPPSQQPLQPLETTAPPAGPTRRPRRRGAARPPRPPRSPRGVPNASSGSADRGPGRRRGIAAVGAVAVLLVVAAIIGSGGGPSDDRSEQVARDGGGAAQSSVDTKAELAPATTIPGLPTASGGSTATEAPTASRYESSDGSASDGGTAQGGGSTRLPTVTAKVIRTGSVDLQVRRGTFAEASQRISSVATGVGGFVSASETSQLGEDPRGTITVRVPARDFDRVLARISALGKVTASTTGSQDVTGEYTDVAARISALQDEREQIRLVLAQARSIPDILSVRDRLSAVQAELEQLQGRQQVLDDQTSLSTLTVTLGEKGRPTPVDTKPSAERTGLSKVWHDSVERFTDGARSIAIGLAAMAPWLLLALILWLPARRLWRRVAYGPATTTESAAPAGSETA